MRGPSTGEDIRDKIHNMSCQNKQQLNLHASQDGIRLLLQAHGGEITAKSQQQYLAIALHDAQMFHENVVCRCAYVYDLAGSHAMTL